MLCHLNVIVLCVGSPELTEPSFGKAGCCELMLSSRGRQSGDHITVVRALRGKQTQGEPLRLIIYIPPRARPGKYFERFHS